MPNLEIAGAAPLMTWYRTSTMTSAANSPASRHIPRRIRSPVRPARRACPMARAPEISDDTAPERKQTHVENPSAVQPGRNLGVTRFPNRGNKSVTRRDRPGAMLGALDWAAGPYERAFSHPSLKGASFAPQEIDVCCCRCAGGWCQQRVGCDSAGGRPGTLNGRRLDAGCPTGGRVGHRDGEQPPEGTSSTTNAVGSGTGITDITGRTVDFGASDAPMTPAQAGRCHGCIQIPWALSATGIGLQHPGASTS